MFNRFSIRSVTASVALAAFWFLSGAAFAGPYVVQDATALSGQIATPVAATSHGQYGGGFIEMLMTGGQSEPSADYAPQPRARQIVSYAPGQSLDVQRHIDPMYQRTEVDYPRSERSGSIVVDTTNKFLYFVKGDGRAIRYGIGVGRPGFVWSGVKTISRKAEWPDWTPPREMLARRPDLPTHMEGGPANPLGARALYLGSSLYRIHGTNEPYTIGQNVSSGCIRMMNEDVVDLYNRARIGMRVVVR